VTTAEAIGTEAAAFVDAEIWYSERAADGGTIFGNNNYSFKVEPHPMRIFNARLDDISFQRNGFTLLKHHTDADLTDQADAERRYYPEAKRLVQELTGAREVFAFFGVMRGGEDAAGGGPALSAHVDFTEAGLNDWIERIAPDRADELKAKKLANINLWRPIKPVESMPLAICDQRSVEKSDFLRISFAREQNGEQIISKNRGFNTAYNPNHRWYYYPDMQPDEVLAFKLLDTRDPERRMTAHTAFEDPNSAPDAPKRLSYELRTIAVFDE
jgi:hypothetical protein